MMKRGGLDNRPAQHVVCLSGDPYVFSLKSLWTFYYVENHSLTFLKATEAITLNSEKCTKTSSPFGRLKKPNPLASLNHLTVPYSIELVPFHDVPLNSIWNWLRVAVYGTSKKDQIRFFDPFQYTPIRRAAMRCAE
jgi:hypothetical protein